MTRVLDLQGSIFHTLAKVSTLRHYTFYTLTKAIYHLIVPIIKYTCAPTFITQLRPVDL